MKIYLVHLEFYDNDRYEPMDYDRIMAVFDSEEKAIQFCKENSDEEEDFLILKDRRIPDLTDDKNYGEHIEVDSFPHGTYTLRYEELKVL